MRKWGTRGRIRAGSLAVLLVLTGLADQTAGATLASPAALERALAQAGPAERSGLLVQLSRASETDDTGRAWDYAQQARREALSPADEINADTRIAALQRRLGDYTAALATARNALLRATELGQPALRAEALLIIANTQDSLADFPAALETFRELLPLADGLGDDGFLARVYNTLGITYADAEQPALALPAYETARRHAEKAGEQRLVASVLNNLGNVAMTTKDFALARTYHKQALSVRQSLGGDARGVADSHQNLGELAVLEGNPAAAIPHLDHAIALHNSLGLKRNLTNAHLTYANALVALGRADEARAHLETAQTLATTLASQTITARVYRAFAAYHENRGDFRLALDYERKFAAATDAAIGEKSRQRFDALQARFATERRQHVIDVLLRDQAAKEAELVHGRRQRYGLLALLGFGIIALAAVISRHRLKLRSEQRIHAKTRMARDAAEQADALKTRLLTVVSHDIRGPLGNVLHLVEDLHAEHASTHVDDRLELIEQQTRQVLDLAQDLLDAAALEAGRLALCPAPMDFTDVIVATVERLRPSAEAKQQVMHFIHPPRDTGVITGDAARLVQVVSNLVSNAIKYAPRKSTVRLSLARQEGVVRLTVQDEGPGIPKEDLPNLFLPFTRLSARPTAGESTHGIGLSIAHELVRLHAGRILVESVPGKGSTFIVELPATV